MRMEPKGFLPVEGPELASVLGSGKYDLLNPETSESRSPPVEQELTKPEIVPPAEEQAAPDNAGENPRGRYSEVAYADPNLPALQASNDAAQDPDKPSGMQDQPKGTKMPSAAERKKTEPASARASSGYSGENPRGRYNETDYADARLLALQQHNDAASDAGLIPVKKNPVKGSPSPKAKGPSQKKPDPVASASFLGTLSGWFSSLFPSPAQKKNGVKPVSAPSSAGSGAKPKNETLPQNPTSAKKGGILAVTKEFFQNGITDSNGKVRSFLNEKDKQYSDDTLGKSSDTIYQSGCLITAVTRIVNAITGSTKDPGDIGELAKSEKLFDTKDEAALTSIEKLVEAGTDKDVKYARIDGTEAQLALKIAEYGKSADACFMIAHLSNGHFVNVNGIDAAGNPIIADTSVRNLSWATMQQSGLKISDLRIVSL